MQRPAWPYIVGIIGGVVFALGAAGFAYTAYSPSASQSVAEASVLVLGLGGVLIAMCWIGLFKLGQGGVGPIGGSLTIPLVLAYGYSQRGEIGSADIVAMLVLLAFLCFALGHAVTKGLGATRVFGGLAAVVLAFAVTALTAKWKINGSAGEALGVVIHGSLIFIGLSLPFALLRLRAAPIDDTRL